MTGAIPPSASVAHTEDGPKMFAPSAERNKDALTALIRQHAPTTGHVLEIASGTGQHITAFAAALPNLEWHPTELDPARRASIDAYVAEAGLGNVARASALDISAKGWADVYAPKDLILCTNLAHLISTAQVQNMFIEVAKVLSPNGKFILYGPFKRSGNLTSEGDARFDAELRGADPAIGYKDDLDIMGWLGDAGLTKIDVVDMPANNLCIIAGYPTP